MKALDRAGQCFQYISNAFPGLSIEKLKPGILDGPSIWKVLKDDYFVNFIDVTKSNTWISFFAVAKKKTKKNTNPQDRFL